MCIIGAIAMRDEVFGQEKSQLLDRCNSLEKAGVGFTLHSDFMVTDPVPLHMIEMAVTRKTWKEPDYVLAPEEVNLSRISHTSTNLRGGLAAFF
jgi:predicted amidohydrolase YtcJ